MQPQIKKRKKLPLHTQIIIGLVLGLIWGLASMWLKVPPQLTIDYIKPFGTVFVNLLKMIAVPLVFVSLVVGVSSLNDVRKLSRIGGKTILFYLITTIIAITIGLLFVNVLTPGKKLPESTRQNLESLYSHNAEESAQQALALKNQSPLKPLVDIVPQNLVDAMAHNGSMLQVVFFALFMGIALINIPKKKRDSVVGFFEGLNDAVIKMVDFIMITAPYGVFALMGSLIIEVAGNDPANALSLLYGLGWYSITVVLGLLCMMFLVYPTILRMFSKIGFKQFFKAIRPAQLLAFSTSSSSATLPVTMECVEKNLGVDEEITSFVLPLGATINMDGTSLYQAVAAVFIAQALQMELTITNQLMIVLTALMASIGSAGVPGAGIIMLVIVLETIGVPTAGIALILAVDRILDMVRTSVNVTGDAAVTTAVAASENSLHKPDNNFE